MSETTTMWMEISFNLLYLVTIWGLTAAMWRRYALVAKAGQTLARLFIWAFALLAFGDTFHVGFRIWAYLLPDSLETRMSLFGWQIGPVGIGALATAVTVTFFYLTLLCIWRARFKRPYGWLGLGLFVVAAIRLVLMAFPANEWNSTVPPQPWGIYRNLPLIVLGLSIACLFLRDARRSGDRAFTWVAYCIFVSYAFYMPVVFFVQKIPLLGMLMIPKTIAYVAIAFIAYRRLFQARSMAPRVAT